MKSTIVENVKINISGKKLTLFLDFLSSSFPPSPYRG
jgi:hypothetical protein